MKPAAPFVTLIAATALACAACSSSTSKAATPNTATPDTAAPTTAAPTTAASASASAFQLTLGSGPSSLSVFDPRLTCDGPEDRSPGLGFAGVPAGTAELALSMVDLDIGKVHWLQVGIPAGAPGLTEHALIGGARELTNDFGEATYDGPCPPKGSTHKYQLTLYALASKLPPSFGQATSPGQSLHQLQSKALASAQITATYTRR